MTPFRSILASLAFTSTVASAQTPPPYGAPPRVDVSALLNLDSTRAQQVDAILKAAHEKMRAAREQIGRPTDETTRTMMRSAMNAIRVETDQQLATVLSAEEIVKLHEAMPGPGKRGRPGG
jgi:periplasmic protein CpxP/Spy